ncbi:hypothetical protein N0B16_13245 [Chryseobacterium sp. GMJ5]|uniref:Transposase n=1 Tax=Chryseobacterium gilvum TaxID=2976534 RepID=A0ABT2VZI9_9FLAO|nr:hypothetical protein [Chryseobacterium gilvum]MCU7615406.1 hypothetical protein [Chryseobacterium gilvum]
MKKTEKFNQQIVSSIKNKQFKKKRTSLLHQIILILRREDVV